LPLDHVTIVPKCS